MKSKLVACFIALSLLIVSSSLDAQNDVNSNIPHTFRNRKEAMKWLATYDRLAPKTGDVAPDFVLRDINGQNPVALSNFRNQKPVALIFGSFT